MPATTPDTVVVESEAKPPTPLYMMGIMAVLGLCAVYVVLSFVTRLVEWAFPYLPVWVYRPFQPGWNMLARLDGIIAQMSLLGLSLIPLATLLLFLPVIMPDESVLANSIQPQRTSWQRWRRRIFAFFAGLSMLIAIFAVSIEIVGMLGLPNGYFGILGKKIIPPWLVNVLPAVLVEQWPYVLLMIYFFDLILLFAIGKVPIQYNLRNIVVRWRISLLTGLAFTVVVGLLTVMLAFLNGLNELTANSGIPGNIFVLSDGATDEIFSNFTRGDISKVELEVATLDRNGDRLPKPVRIMRMPKPGTTDEVILCSKETYFIINQPIPTLPGEKAKRRFVQLRGIDDPFVAGQVHNIAFIEGGWFDETGVKDLPSGQRAVPAVIGEGAAVALGLDYGKDQLHVGDTFKLGELDMVAEGIMKSAGTTYGSEIWVKNDRVAQEFGKQSFSTLVLRVEDQSGESAEVMAYHYANRYKSPRVKAVPEPIYYSELGKTNSQLFSVVAIVAAIMAIGGVFGVMNTMFAAIAQRTRDIGVLRVLGFKRWQILVSFMLESLFIALLGGMLGCLLGSMCDGLTAQSIVASGPGGGKTVVLTITMDRNVIVCGILFTLIMGRLGGLLPALSGMRLGILESLR